MGLGAVGLYAKLNNFPWDNPVAAEALPTGHGEMGAAGAMNEVTASLEARLAAEFDHVLLAEQPDPQAFLAAHGSEFEAFVTSAGVGYTADTLARLTKLRAISSFGVGLDKLDLAAAKARGIAVGYTPDVLNDCVADLAMVLMLDIARRVSEADRYVRRGAWTTPGAKSFPLARKVSGARLGIVGLGRIGNAIAKRAEAFDMTIAYELGVSEATIKAHVSAILQKLGVESRTQAVIAAAKIAGGDWRQGTPPG